MTNSLATLREWGERTLLSMFLRKYHIFNKIKLEVKDIASDGLILDIGGGGEGVISRLKGIQVVAIDLFKEELVEIIDGSQKIVMDARQLAFPDESFETATAFFSMMFMKTRDDHQRVMNEVSRVLKPAGHLLVWDIDLVERPASEKEHYFVQLQYRVGNFKKVTGYGVKWPHENRGETYYLQLAAEAGFQHLVTERADCMFYFEFIKPI